MIKRLTRTLTGMDWQLLVTEAWYMEDAGPVVEAPDPVERSRFSSISSRRWVRASFCWMARRRRLLIVLRSSSEF